MHLRFVTRVHFIAALAAVTLIAYSIWVYPSLQVTTRLTKVWSGHSKIIVVFGDSFSDTGEQVDDISAIPDELTKDFRAVRWTDVLCTELDCDDVLNFALSTTNRTAYSGGVVVDNDVYINTTTQHDSPPKLLPDFKEQIEAWIRYENGSISSDSDGPEEEYIFAMTFGFWDIWQYATLDLHAAQDAIASSIATVFGHMDFIAESIDEPVSFILPRLWDVSFTPRFMSLAQDHDSQPRRFSEEQHKLIYLIKYWNAMLVQYAVNWKSGYIYLPEWNNWLLDQIRLVQMKKLGLSDSLGLGSEPPIFKDVSNPCLKPTTSMASSDDSSVAMTASSQCENPREHLFWDDTQFGIVAHELLGTMAAKMLSSKAATNAREEIHRSSSNANGTKPTMAKLRLAPSLAPGN